ncbi:hypothetical protein NQ315_001442 [Exocentrus adspersus]|uniref:Secreted protein n=1 Tax=Exocentrus adspersus TaxID=1586481 RepID=A0AAV8W8A6_9CUCU|nr:hypothetical protein NQ315_001442 [Exocentrus adspersus]
MHHIAIILVAAACVALSADVATLQKNDDYPDYQLGFRYDEYPVSIPKLNYCGVHKYILWAMFQFSFGDEQQAERRTAVVPPLGAD